MRKLGGIMKTIRILAVDDPAVQTYIDPQANVLGNIEKILGIHLEMNIISFEAYFDTLMEAFQEDQVDLVMVAGHLWLPSFVEKGWLAPLKNQKTDEDVLAKIQLEMAVEGISYLRPSFCDGHMLVYRRGGSLGTLPEKLSILDVLSMLEEKALHGQFALKAHPSEIFLDMLPYFRAHHVDPVDVQGNVVLSEEAFQEVLGSYKKAMTFAPKDTMTFGNVDIAKRLQDGRALMAVTWGGQLGEVTTKDCEKVEDLGYAALEESWNVTWSFGINEKSREKELAEEVLALLTSKEVDLLVGRRCGNPTRKSSFLKDRERYPWYGTLEKMIEEAELLPFHKALPETLGIMTKRILEGMEEERS